MKIATLLSLCVCSLLQVACANKPANEAAIPVPVAAPAQTATPDSAAAPKNNGNGKEAKATYYGTKDGFAGKKTASGDTMNPQSLTAASPTLPLGSKVKVTDKDSGRAIEVTINDRQPKKKGASIDLSKKAAEEIGMVDKGTATVVITPVP